MRILNPHDGAFPGSEQQDVGLTKQQYAMIHLTAAIMPALIKAEPVMVIQKATRTRGEQRMLIGHENMAALAHDIAAAACAKLFDGG